MRVKPTDILWLVISTAAVIVGAALHYCSSEPIGGFLVAGGFLLLLAFIFIRVARDEGFRIPNNMPSFVAACAEIGLVATLDEVRKKNPREIHIDHGGWGYGRTTYWAVFEAPFDIFCITVDGHSEIAIKNGLLISDFIGVSLSKRDLQKMFGLPVSECWSGVDEQRKPFAVT
jgi:hypothetical protein